MKAAARTGRAERRYSRGARARMRGPLGAFALAISLGACGGGERVVPEKGAALLHITAAATAVQPDELRVWIYDDGGRLWDGARVPETGVLVARAPGDYGTLLVQPGAIRGSLRVHVRAIASATRVLDAVASIAPALLGTKTVDLKLDPAVLADGDGDDVPDAIDDCATQANPAQGGCGQGDAGAGDQSDGDVGEDGAGGAAIGSGGGGGKGAAGGSGGTGAQGGAGTSGGAGAGGGRAASGGVIGSGGNPATGGSLATGGKVAAGGSGASGGIVGAGGGGASGGVGGRGNGGAGGAVDRPNGQSCTAASQCQSHFCADGFCCNSACDMPCQSCSTGTCQAVKKAADVPQCAGTMMCNARGDCVSSG